MHGPMLNIFPKILKINGHLTHSFRWWSLPKQKTKNNFTLQIPKVVLLSSINLFVL